MEEQVKELLLRFELLDKLINNVQNNLMLTWAILAVIVGVLALTGLVLIKKWVNDKVEKELVQIKDEVKELQSINKQLIHENEQGRESGLWTPYLDNSLHNYSSQQGTYHRLGDLAILKFDLQICYKDMEALGKVALVGLPFSSNELIYCNIMLINFETANEPGTCIQLTSKIQNMNKLYLFTSGDGRKYDKLDYNSISSTASISGTIIYRIA